jgi:peptide/nickel transport system substrate-binding protein
VGLVVALLPGCTRVEADDAESRLSVLVSGEPQSLDPRFVWDTWGLRVSRLIFASLFTIDPVKLDAVPDLAAGAERIGDREWVVRLKPGLTFSDGSTLDAHDVVETYRGVIDPSLGSRFAATYSRIERVEALSALEVRFVLEEPHATFLTDLELPIVRRRDARSVMAETPSALVGAGPYRLREREVGRVALEANPHWHGGTPRHPNVDIVVVRDDNTRALRLLGGRGDLAPKTIPSLLVPLFVGHPAFEIRHVGGPGTTYVGLNHEVDALRDARVRQALVAAIDRELLVRAKLGGRGRVASSFIPGGHWASVGDLAPHRFDPERARALLREAGYGPGGATLSLVMRVTSDRTRISLGRAIAAMLGRVGVEVDVRPSETAHLRADLDAGRFELTLMEVPEVIEPHFLSWFFASDRIPSATTAGANRWRFRNDEIDAAFERGVRTFDRDDRKHAYADVQRILHREMPVIPLFHEDVVVVVKRGLAYEAPRDGRLAPLARALDIESR